MGHGTSRREFVTKSLLGVGAASPSNPALGRLAPISNPGAGPLVLVPPDSPLPERARGDLSAWLSRRGDALEFAGPGPDRGSFMPFHEVGAGAPYPMFFDPA